MAAHAGSNEQSTHIPGLAPTQLEQTTVRKKVNQGALTEAYGGVGGCTVQPEPSGAPAGTKSLLHPSAHLLVFSLDDGTDADGCLCGED